MSKTKIEKISDSVINGLEWMSDPDNSFFVTLCSIFTGIIGWTVCNLYSMWMTSAPFSWTALFLGSLMFVLLILGLFICIPFILYMFSVMISLLCDGLYCKLTSTK